MVKGDREKMPIRIFVPWVALAGVLGICIGGSYVWLLKEPTAQNMSRPNRHVGPTSTETIPNQYEVPRTLGESLAIIWERTWEDPISFYTLVLAAFTGVLGLATMATLGVGIFQIWQSRREFIATHRPKLILRGAFSEISDPLDGPMVITYSIANIGETRARIVQIIVGVEWSRFEGYPASLTILDASKEEPLRPPALLAVGESLRRIHEADNHHWDDEHKLLCQSLRPPLGLHFVGHLIYVDDAGVRRQIAWRRR
jgi:hypothetical protein